MYKLTQTDVVIRLDDGASIPPDPLNRDYQKYVLDVESGVTAEDADPEPEREPTRAERIISATDVRKERLAAKKAAILASGLPTATKTAMADLLDGMADIVDGLVEAIQGGKP